MSFGQTPVTTVYARGGSSKALFLKRDDIPPPGPLRDNVLLRLIGSPDPIQIDGMGGSRIVTSKIAIIGTSRREDADIDYEFAQCGVEERSIGYDGNCGNISSGVGPFAIDEGLITKPFRKGVSPAEDILTREVRIWQTGTKKLLVAHVPIDEKTGKSVSQGDFAIAAVPGTGAPILMDFRNTVGASRNQGALPTGHAIDTVTIGQKKVDITVCDVANIIVYVRAEDMGISGYETAKEISADKDLIARCKELRGKAANLVGMCKDWEKVDEQSPGLPMVCMVAAPDSSEGDLSARLLLNNSCHDSMAGTGAICIGACSRISGSIVNRFTRPTALDEKVLHISHPLGIMPTWVELAIRGSDSGGTEHVFNTLSFVRTSRRIMEGVAYVPVEVWGGRGNTAAKTNGHTIGVMAKKSTPSKVDSTIPVTKSFAEFVARTTYDTLPATVINSMKTYLLDYIGNASYGARHSESSNPIFHAIQAFSSGASGTSTVLTKGQKYAPQHAALLNATFAHSLDFDDTFAAGALHPGVTVISAALATASSTSTPTTGSQFLAALAVGYEVTCRLGRALGTGGYIRGFHNTSTAGIFGAVAAIAHVKALSVDTIETAFGLAGSQASGSMQYLASGSWNKRLHPGFAAHGALLSVALAEAGVTGSEQAVEGTYGLLNGYSSTSSTAGLLDGLGREWVCTETSIKPYPCCRMAHGAIDLAVRMRDASGGKQVDKLTLALAPDMYEIVGVPAQNKVHPRNTVDAQFSAYYQLTLAWLDGSATGLKVYERMNDDDVKGMCERVAVEKDERLVGLATRLTVRWADGTESRDMVEKTQVSGESENLMTMAKVTAKFISLAEPVYGRMKAGDIADLVDRMERCDTLEELAGLVA